MSGFPSGDTRTVWQLAFSEEGLDAITKKASAAEKQFDRIVASAVKAGAAMGSFGSSQVLQPFSNAELAARNLKQQLQQSNQTLSDFTQGGKNLIAGWSTVATGALAAVAAAAVLAGRELAKLDEHAVKAFGERTSTIRAYSTILGDARQAQVEYSRANELASKTELTSASTLKAQQALIVAGFRGSDLTNALAASMDVASTKQPEERELTMERMGRAFSQILAAGKLRGSELNQLAEAGVNRGQVLEILGKGDSAKGEKLVSGGSVSSQQGIAAIQQSILNTLGTKQLGQFATGAAGSMSGLLSNRDESLDLLLKSFSGESLPAVIRYKEALTAQTEALSLSSETGQGLVMMLSDFTSITSNVKTMWTDFSTAFLQSFVESYNEAREGQPAFVVMTDGLKELGRTLGKVGGLVGDVADAFEGFMEVMNPIGKWLGNLIAGIGEAYAAFKSGNVQAGWAAMDKIAEGPSDEVEVNTQNDDGSMTTKRINVRELDEERAKLARRRSREEADPKGEGPIPEAAVQTKWGKTSKGGGKGAGGKGGGFNVAGLLGMGGSVSVGSGESDDGPDSISGRLAEMRSAAAAVSSARSAPTGATEGAVASASGGAISVRVEAGAVVVSGVSDPTAAASLAIEMLVDRIGRSVRAPGPATI
jgi:tape measure domain-containing protein